MNRAAGPERTKLSTRNDNDDFARLTNLADGILAVAMTFLAFTIPVPPPVPGGRKSYSTAVAVESLLNIPDGFERDPIGCSLSLNTIGFRRPAEDRP
jgi:hypothetical protein